MTSPTQSLESAIVAAGATKAPRITPDDIEANIASESYFSAADGVRFGWLTSDHSDPDQRNAVERIAFSIRARGQGGICAEIDANSNGVVQPPLALLTFCVLVLRNGFAVTGESACASPENFNADIGRRIARENALAKIWPLMGYELRSKLADAAGA